MPEYHLLVNGFAQTVAFSRESIDGALIPLLRHLTEMRRARDRRLVVYLAAPPGAGKSTLAAPLEILSKTTPDLEPLQALGMDGFHHRQNYIQSHTVTKDGHAIPMSLVKGCPESYDLERMTRAIANIREPNATWPVYDRNLHDVSDVEIQVEAPIVLIEGNWMLLDEPGWRELRELCDFAVTLCPLMDSLKERLIGRKIRGGSAPEEAKAHFDRCDGPNIRRCLSRQLPADAMLQALSDGRISYHIPYE